MVGETDSGRSEFLSPASRLASSSGVVGALSLLDSWVLGSWVEVISVPRPAVFLLDWAANPLLGREPPSRLLEHGRLSPGLGWGLGPGGLLVEVWAESQWSRLLRRQGVLGAEGRAGGRTPVVTARGSRACGGLGLGVEVRQKRSGHGSCVGRACGGAALGKALGSGEHGFHTGPLRGGTPRGSWKALGTFTKPLIL